MNAHIPALTIAQQRGRFVILAGKARLAVYPTRAAAEAALIEDAAMLQFWAGSAGVSIQNTPARVVDLRAA